MSYKKSKRGKFGAFRQKTLENILRNRKDVTKSCLISSAPLTLYKVKILKLVIYNYNIFKPSYIINREDQKLKMHIQETNMSENLSFMISQPTDALFQECLRDFYETEIKNIRKNQDEQAIAFDPTDRTNTGFKLKNEGSESCL